MKIEIKSRFDGHIIISGEYESIKDCLQKNRGANLGYADLRGANLGGAYLRGADLGGAYLRGAKGYSESHDVFTEGVRRQPVHIFVTAEWVAIAQITIHRLCWDSIRKRFADVMPSIFKKLANAGFPEYLARWEELAK